MNDKGTAPSFAAGAVPFLIWTYMERKGNGAAVSDLIPSGPAGVVLPDEETRICGRWGTTSQPPKAHPARPAWCFRTKEQGFAGGEAPRPAAEGSLPPTRLRRQHGPLHGLAEGRFLSRQNLVSAQTTLFFLVIRYNLLEKTCNWCTIIHVKN